MRKGRNICYDIETIGKLNTHLMCFVGVSSSYDTYHEIGRAGFEAALFILNRFESHGELQPFLLHVLSLSIDLGSQFLELLLGFFAHIGADLFDPLDGFPFTLQLDLFLLLLGPPRALFRFKESARFFHSLSFQSQLIPLYCSFGLQLGLDDLEARQLFTDTSLCSKEGNQITTWVSK